MTSSNYYIYVKYAESVVRDYLLLGLRFGRLVDGWVDCWFGDPALARQVAGEPAPEPARLAREAKELLAALASSGLPPDRRAFLAAQLRALRCAARKLAGDRIGFRAEVREYFDVAVEPSDLGRYAALHDELATLLPGRGPLRERLVAFRAASRLDARALGPAMRTVTDALRERFAAALDLPPGEHIHHEVEVDQPWNAFNRYQGGYRSTITLNADAGHWSSGLAIVASHEAYPGHHAERCLKERLLVRRRGQAEHAVVLVNTPQCLISEGMAEHGLAVLGDGWGSWIEGLLRPLGCHVDGVLAERVDRVMQRLTEVRQDAAIMLHDRGADPDDVAAFLSRWMLVDADAAGQALRFLADPLWRAYVTTYVEGRRLVGRWLAARPAGEPILARYRRLLTEPLLPATLRAELNRAELKQAGLNRAEPKPGAGLTATI